MRIRKHFFFSIYEKDRSVHSAASELKIPPSTTQNWLKKEEAGDGNKVFGRQSGSGTPAERPSPLNDLEVARDRHGLYE